MLVGRSGANGTSEAGFDGRRDAAARERGRAEMAAAAATVMFDRRRDVVTMRSGVVAMIPRALIPIVAEAEPNAAEEVELSPMGSSLRFPSLDADFAVQGLIRRVFGINEANRLASATKSKARAAASRSNGLKGGQPRTKTA
jgi:hypothetical protein